MHIDAVVQHQQVYFGQQLGQLGFRAQPPAHLAQGDWLAVGVGKHQGAIAAAEGDQLGSAAMPLAQQGLAQGAAGPGDRHGERWV